jgi:restriction system protein
MNMSVPDYQSLMGPLLGALDDGEAHRMRDLRPQLAEQLGLTDEDLVLTIPSGANLFANRLHWAATYMAQAGLLTRPRRGYAQITPRGMESLAARGDAIDNAHLSDFQEFRDFQARARGTSRRATTDPSQPTADDPVTSTSSGSATPSEAMEALISEANASLAGDLLERIRANDPAFLERLVLRVLTRMGYGERSIGAAEHLGRSGDEGIDGVIRQDALGLERIYVQAKRYAADRAISRPDIQAFVGALHGQQADRGVFITTSRFTADARDYAERVNARIILIDGEYLARLMIRHNVGVQDEETFTLKRLDEDFFIDD